MDASYTGAGVVSDNSVPPMMDWSSTSDDEPLSFTSMSSTIHNTSSNNNYDNNYHNPSGTMIPSEEILSVLTELARRDTAAFMDLQRQASDMLTSKEEEDTADLERNNRLDYHQYDQKQQQQQQQQQQQEADDDGGGNNLNNGNNHHQHLQRQHGTGRSSNYHQLRSSLRQSLFRPIDLQDAKSMCIDDDKMLTALTDLIRKDTATFLALKRQVSEKQEISSEQPPAAAAPAIATSMSPPMTRLNRKCSLVSGDDWIHQDKAIPDSWEKQIKAHEAAVQGKKAAGPEVTGSMETTLDTTHDKMDHHRLSVAHHEGGLLEGDDYDDDDDWERAKTNLERVETKDLTPLVRGVTLAHLPSEEQIGDEEDFPSTVTSSPLLSSSHHQTATLTAMMSAHTMNEKEDSTNNNLMSSTAAVVAATEPSTQDAAIALYAFQNSKNKKQLDSLLFPPSSSSPPPPPTPSAAQDFAALTVPTEQQPPLMAQLHLPSSPKRQWDPLAISAATSTPTATTRVPDDSGVSSPQRETHSSESKAYHTLQPESGGGIGGISERDVLLGRGKVAHAHVGNQTLRDLIQQHCQAYQATKNRSEKNEITNRIIDQIQNAGGRFLKCENASEEECTLSAASSGSWLPVSRAVAYEKVSHALRSRQIRPKKTAAMQQPQEPKAPSPHMVERQALLLEQLKSQSKNSNNGDGAAATVPSSAMTTAV